MLHRALLVAFVLLAAGCQSEDKTASDTQDVSLFDTSKNLKFVACDDATSVIIKRCAVAIPDQLTCANKNCASTLYPAMPSNDFWGAIDGQFPSGNYSVMNADDLASLDYVIAKMKAGGASAGEVAKFEDFRVNLVKKRDLKGLMAKGQKTDAMLETHEFFKAIMKPFRDKYGESIPPPFPSNPKKCQTSEEMRAHVGPGTRPRLFDDAGNVVKNLDERFCLHTVTDGRKNLDNGGALIDAQQRQFIVERGLLVAIGDVGHYSLADSGDGVNFKETQQVCGALTLLGKRWMSPSSVAISAKPQERNPCRSFEALALYFDENRDFDQIFEERWYSSSRFDDFLAYQWVRKRVTADPDFWKSGVRCIVAL